jgi:branched-chain amino acid aminotransferase
MMPYSVIPGDNSYIDGENLEMYCFHDGETVSVEAASISVESLGLRYALSVFEGIRGYFKPGGYSLFCYDRHINRLANSTGMLHMKPRYINSAIKEIEAVVLANGIKEDFYVRYSVTASGKGTIGLDSDECIETITVTPMGRKKWLRESACVNLNVSSMKAIPDACFPSQIKNISNYAPGRIETMKSIKAGYDLPLFLTMEGYIAESTTANIFFVKNNKLYTPSLDTGILPGITRSVIMEIANEVGIECIEGEFTITDISPSDEAFLCGTGIEIAPVGKLNDIVFGDGSCGKLSSMIINEYFNMARRSNESNI